jgi:hypothetical protein
MMVVRTLLVVALLLALTCGLPVVLMHGIMATASDMQGSKRGSPRIGRALRPLSVSGWRTR